MSNQLRIFCLVDGEAASNAFPVSASPTTTVGELKDLIKTKIPDTFNGVDAKNLTLWRVSIPIVTETKHQPVFLDKCESKEELLPADELCDVFGDSVLKKRAIHILVERPPLTQQSNLADKDAFVNFTITVKGITPKTFTWMPRILGATLDDLWDTMYSKHPILKDRSKTIAYEDQGYLIGYLITDDDLRSYLKSRRPGNKHLVLRLEDPGKPFSDITSQDTIRLYGVSVRGSQTLDDSELLSLSSEEHLRALDNLYVTLDAAVSAMSPSSSEYVSAPEYYSGAFLMHAVSLFPELQVKPGKKVAGRRAFGPLDYAVECKADPSRMLAFTTYPPAEWGKGVACNAVQLDTISSNRKRRRSDDDGDDDSTAPIVSYGIATDSTDWYLQKCTIDKPDESGYNFPKFHSSRIPLSLSFTCPKDEWRADAKEVFRHVVSHISKMVDDIPRSKRPKVEQ